MDDRIPGEQFLRENGFLFIHPVGKSMLPLFRGGLETVALAPPDDIRVGDVVWYRRTDRANHNKKTAKYTLYQ